MTTNDELREAHEQIAGFITHPATLDYIAALEALIAARQQRIGELEKALEQAQRLALYHETEWIDAEFAKPAEERRPLIHIQWGQLASILGEALHGGEKGGEG